MYSKYLSIDVDEGVPQTMYISLVATSKKMYSYTDSATGFTYSKRIVVELSKYLEIYAVYNEAPRFIDEKFAIKSITLPLKSQLIIELPEIVDPDSE